MMRWAYLARASACSTSCATWPSQCGSHVDSHERPEALHICCFERLVVNDSQSNINDLISSRENDVALRPSATVPDHGSSQPTRSWDANAISDHWCVLKWYGLLGTTFLWPLSTPDRDRVTLSTLAWDAVARMLCWHRQVSPRSCTVSTNGPPFQLVHNNVILV